VQNQLGCAGHAGVKDFREGSGRHDIIAVECRLGFVNRRRSDGPHGHLGNSGGDEQVVVRHMIMVRRVSNRDEDGGFRNRASREVGEVGFLICSI
jgi:hypothetical protein